MPFIYESARWPELQWDAAQLTGVLAEVRHGQGRHLGRMEALGFDLRGEANLRTLTTEVVKSWAIEGESLDPDEVRSSLAMRLGLDTAGLPTASREVDGITEMMLDATRCHDKPLTAERLQAWHAALFPTGRSGLSRITVGAWRTDEEGPMVVVSGPVGRERVHYTAPAATRLDEEMQRFLEWFESSAALDPVLASGVAHLWFLTLHPFDDGNGRIARAISDMLLSRADGTDARFYSLSAQIERERKDYYSILESSQRGDEDITSWLAWYLGCLGRAIDGAEETLGLVMRKARFWQATENTALNGRQNKVVNHLLDGFDGNLTNAKYAKLTKCSPDTALRDIRQLLDLGVLIKNAAGGRSTSYALADFDR